MPIIKSAKKREKQEQKREKQNELTKSLYRGAFKRLTHAVQNGYKDFAQKLLPYVFKTLDTAAKKNVLHKNKAARHKSQASKMIENIDTAANTDSEKTASKKSTAKKASTASKSPKTSKK